MECWTSTNWISKSLIPLVSMMDQARKSHPQRAPWITGLDPRSGVYY
jgi:hypothetical protein